MRPSLALLSSSNARVDAARPPTDSSKGITTVQNSRTAALFTRSTRAGVCVGLRSLTRRLNSPGSLPAFSHSLVQQLREDARRRDRRARGGIDAPYPVVRRRKIDGQLDGRKGKERPYVQSLMTCDRAVLEMRTSGEQKRQKLQ